MAWYTTSTITAPPTLTRMLYRSKPLMPVKPSRLAMKPPTTAPTIPSTMSIATAFALFVDQLAGNKPGDKAHDEPRNDSHTHAPFKVRRHVG